MAPRKRSEMDPRYLWNTESIFADADAFEEELQAVSDALPAAAAYQGRLSEGPSTLADAFETLDSLRMRLFKLFAYAHCRRDADTTDQAAAAAHDRVLGLAGRAMTMLAFVEPELLAIGIPTLREWVGEELRLSHLAHYVEVLARMAPHVRSPEVEELLGALMDPFRSAENIHGLLANAELTFRPARTSLPAAEERPVTQGTIDALLTSPDRELRRTAYESYADAHLALKNTMAACLATGVKHNVFYAHARRYGSALEASLENNHIPVAVYHNTVEAFRRNLPVWHRYWALKRDLLGYETLHPYDAKAPLLTEQPTITFEQAVDWICDGLAPLGEEYVARLRRGVLEERWVDVYPNIGKKAGAYSSGTQGTIPLILMNFNNDVYGLSTLAHELGHSMHSLMTWETQPPVYARYGIFMAEIASNLNQALVRDHLLSSADDRNLQIALIEEALSNYHRYFFLMPTLARLELAMHERIERGQALTADDLISMTADLFAEAFGSEVEMDRDRVGITWAQFHTHLYMNFYVYQYTTGIAGAQALADRILSETPGAVESYLEFLSVGSSVFPLDAVSAAGVDLTTPEPIDRAFAHLQGLIDRLESLTREKETNA
ncbi:MAG: oligoendopeptidase F [Anaerolineae bacterium]